MHKWLEFHEKNIAGSTLVIGVAKLRRSRIHPGSRSHWGRDSPNVSASPLTLVQEFVIEDAGCNSRAFRFFLRVFGSSNASLAEHGAVFLARNLFWHLEHHLH